MKKLVVITLSIVLPLVVLVIAATGILSPVQPTISPLILPVEQPIVQDAHLLEVLKSTGATKISALNIKSTATLYDTDASGTYTEGDTTISVLPNLSPSLEKMTIAHEYLHYIYYNVMTTAQKEALTPIVNTLLENDPKMQKRVQNYKDKGTLNTTELFSMYCTESSNQYIGSLANTCNQYIDRSSLVFIR